MFCMHWATLILQLPRKDLAVNYAAIHPLVLACQESPNAISKQCQTNIPTCRYFSVWALKNPFNFSERQEAHWQCCNISTSWMSFPTSHKSHHPSIRPQQPSESITSKIQENNMEGNRDIIYSKLFLADFGCDHSPDCELLSVGIIHYLLSLVFWYVI